MALRTMTLVWLLWPRNTSATGTCTWWSDSSSNPVENVNFNECANRVTYQTVRFHCCTALETTGSHREIELMRSRIHKSSDSYQEMSSVNWPIVDGIGLVKLFFSRYLYERVSHRHFIVNTNTYNSLRVVNCPIVDGIGLVNWL